MGRKIEHQDSGTVLERRFPGVAPTEELRSYLKRFREQGVISGFRFGTSGLVVQRPRVEGAAPEEFFRDATAKEAIDFSRDLFRLVLKEVKPLHEEGSGHGALHPGNIIVAGQSGIRTPDALLNRSCLTPQAIDPPSVWLWGAGVPQGWSLADWDKISLLRTAALLAEGPEAWEGTLQRSEAERICRQWAGKVNATLPGGSDLGEEVLAVTALIDDLGDATFGPLFRPPPIHPIEEELQALAKQGGRVLRAEAEAEVRQRAAAAGLTEDEIIQRIELWLLGSGLLRDREVDDWARDFLEASRDEAGLVKRRACAAAERCYELYGIDAEEAKRRLGELLDEIDGLDERELGASCRRYVEGHLSVPVSRLEADQVERMVDGFAAESRQPRPVAGRLVSLELERLRLGV